MLGSPAVLIRKSTMSKSLEDDSDPTYTHFAHRAEFLKLLSRFLSIDVERQPLTREDEEEERLVGNMGAVVSLPQCDGIAR